jgi:hypothetical protein
MTPFFFKGEKMKENYYRSLFDRVNIFATQEIPHSWGSVMITISYDKRIGYVAISIFKDDGSQVTSWLANSIDMEEALQEDFLITMEQWCTEMVAEYIEVE